MMVDLNIFAYWFDDCASDFKGASAYEDNNSAFPINFSAFTVV